MNEYEKLTQFVNDNLSKQNKQKIVFEYLDNLDENIHAFPLEKLLSIENDEMFVYEVYYKMINRIIDTHNAEILLKKLKNGNKDTRIDIIRGVYNSKERRIKRTNLIFTEEYGL